MGLGPSTRDGKGGEGNDGGSRGGGGEGRGGEGEEIGIHGLKLVPPPMTTARLRIAVLAGQASATVGVRTCWPWKTAATLPSARLRKALRRPRGEKRGGAIRWRPPAYSLFGVRCACKLHVFVCN